MKQRGRPRHPDVLTPREWEVLELLREGRTNEEIAEALAITERTAKYHVSEIMGKLGVNGRHEAAAWRPEQRPWWAAALASLPLAAATKVGLIAASAAAIAGAGVGAWGIMRTDGSREEEVLPSPTPAIGDHWHAALTIRIDGEQQPDIADFSGPEGVHTHGDGMFHTHPFIPEAEGPGSTVRRFFEYGNGLLDFERIRVPGTADTHEGGVTEVLRAESGVSPVLGFSSMRQACDGLPESEYQTVGPDYIPLDGDCIRITFQTSNSVP